MLKKKLLIIAGIIAGTALLGLVGVFLFNSKEYFSNQFGRNWERDELNSYKKSTF